MKCVLRDKGFPDNINLVTKHLSLDYSYKITAFWNLIAFPLTKNQCDLKTLSVVLGSFS